MEAIVLAGGYSSRAKKFKMTLEIGEYTVLEHTLSKFENICERVIVVSGYEQEKIEEVIRTIKANRSYNMKIKNIFNPNYDAGMFTSIQAGCKEIKASSFFITPGDCPLVKKDTISELSKVEGDVIIPSYAYRGGHPIKLSQEVKKSILQAEPSDNLRNILKNFKKEYRDVDDEAILMDIDTLEDYEKIKTYYKIKYRK